MDVVLSLHVFYIRTLQGFIRLNYLSFYILPQQEKAATFFRHTEKHFSSDIRRRINETKKVLGRKELFSMSKECCRFFVLW